MVFVMNVASLSSVYTYRGFVLNTVKREFQTKYRNSVLGIAWNVLNPLAMILVYTVVFSQVMRAKLPGVETKYAYSLYLCAGLLTWGLFADLLGRCQTVFLDHANLLKKIHFPRLCLPVAVVISALLNFSIIFGLFTLFLVVTGNFPGWVYVAILPVVGSLVLFAVGLGMTLGVLNVFFRDIGQVFGVFIQFWFWLTPVVYPVAILPYSYQRLIACNPLSSVVLAMQSIVLDATVPCWSSLLPVTVLGLVLCQLGLFLYRKHAADLLDEL